MTPERCEIQKREGGASIAPKCVCSAEVAEKCKDVGLPEEACGIDALGTALFSLSKVVFGFLGVEACVGRHPMRWRNLV